MTIENDVAVRINAVLGEKLNDCRRRFETTTSAAPVLGIAVPSTLLARADEVIE